MHTRMVNALVSAATAMERAERRSRGRRMLKTLATVTEVELAAHHATGWMFWRNGGSDRFGGSVRRTAIRKLLVCFFHGYGEVPEQLLPDLVVAATEATAAMLFVIKEDSRDDACAKAPVVETLIGVLRRCVDWATEPAARNNAAKILVGALHLRYRYTGDRAALDDAVAAAHLAVESSTEEDEATESRTVLAATLGVRGKSAVDGASARHDLDSAVRTARRALERAGDLTHPHQEVGILNLLCDLLGHRFVRSGVEADLNDAVAHGLQAVERDGGGPDGYLSLPGALRLRYRHTGAQAALDEFLWHSRAAAAVTPPGHENRAASRAQLATALVDRFQHLGTAEDLNEAVDVLREAVAATGPTDEEHGLLLTDLGVAMFLRHQEVGASSDLDGAIECHRRSIAVTPYGSSDPGRIRTNLSVTLGARFLRENDRSDVNEAVQVAREAVAVTPAGHPELAARLANLGARLLQRFGRFPAEDDLNEAVRVSSRAAKIVPADSPVRLAVREAFGTARLRQFIVTSDLPTVDRLIAELTEMSDALPADHHRQGILLARLGQAAQERFWVTGRGPDGLAAEGWFAQAGATPALYPVVRTYAWIEAAQLAADRDDLAVAAERFERAALLSPLLATTRLHRGDQQFHLAAYPGTAAAAAALILRVWDDPGRALSVLELGRGVLLSQALNTRDDVAGLRDRDSGLARRYLRLRDQLDDDGHSFSLRGSESEVWLRERVAGDRQRTVEAFERVLAEIRALPGFHGFGLPPDPADLRPPRGVGTVVVLNVSKYGSDALLVTADGVDHVPLPGLATDEVTERSRALRAATEARSHPDTTEAEYLAAEAVLPETLAWLWDVAAGPVLDAVGVTGPPPAGEAWPHVWWVLGGPLALMPLHAAGRHDERDAAGHRRAVVDRVISSYAPTVRAVHHAYRSGGPEPAAGRSLIVAVPDDLPHVLDEAETLSRLLPNVAVLLSGPRPASISRRVVKGAPDPDRVRTKLADVEIAHFACHGVTDPVDPARSGLLLGAADDLFTVAHLDTLRSTTARLVFLSACSTARNDVPALADESIHLVSACQMAGFAHVVGTLWPVGDVVARTVAEDFYRSLRTDSGQLAPDRAAATLHALTRRRRDRGGSAWSWAAWVHAGRGPARPSPAAVTPRPAPPS